MQLSKKTIDVLRNFSTINQGLVFNEGSTLRTISGMKNILATAIVPDHFAKKFAVYDLNEFLSTISLFANPEIEFEDEYFTISEDATSVNYFYCNPSVVISPPNKEIKVGDPEVEFFLTKETFEKMQKASGVMNLKDFVIRNGEILVLNKNNVGNKYKIKHDMKFSSSEKEFVMEVENLKLIPFDYDVVVTKTMAKFKTSSGDLEYIVALETNK